MTKTGRKELLITIILFILIFSMRLPYINNSAPESGDLWRQADTESIARNYVEREFNIFYPQFNYDGPPPNYVQLEFQITTFLIAILYKIFGYHNFLGRLVPSLLFMVSVYYLFKLIKEIYSTRAAWLTIFIYGILPINLFFSRAIMPESAVLCFFNGAFYYFYKWYENEKIRTLFLSGIFTALAISQKTPAIFIGLAMILICIDKYGFSFLKKWELWVFGGLALIPPFAYIKWAGSVAKADFISGIGAKHILPQFATAFLSPEALDFYKMALPRSFTMVFLLLAFIGLFTLRKKEERPLLYLALAMVLETIFIVSVIKFRYYLIFLTPVIAILAGRVLDIVLSRIRWSHVLLAGLLIFSSYRAYDLVKDDYVVHQSIMDFARVVDDHTEEEDLIVIGTFDPARLSMSNRRGWRANINAYDYIPSEKEEEVDYFIENGAKYFVVRDGYIYNDHGDYLNYLEENFESIEPEEGYSFYLLR